MSGERCVMCRCICAKLHNICALLCNICAKLGNICAKLRIICAKTRNVCAKVPIICAQLCNICAKSCNIFAKLYNYGDMSILRHMITVALSSYTCFLGSFVKYVIWMHFVSCIDDGGAAISGDCCDTVALG